METGIDYRGAIQAEIQHIPEEHLAHLYQIILLLAQPFKEKDPEVAPQGGEKKITQEDLQAYADKFRKSFSLFMKTEVGLNFSFQIQEKFTVLKLTFPDKEEQVTPIKKEEFDLDKICEENQVSIVYDETSKKYALKNLLAVEPELKDNYSEKMLVFTEEVEVYFIETSDPQKWQPDNASADSRNLTALMLRVGDLHQKSKIQPAL